jgi:ArsR family transcriptional regulator
MFICGGVVMREYHCCHAKEAEKNIPDDIISMDLADFFKVFGDGTRIKLLFALLNQELCVHDISKMLNMNQSAISHQLRYLRQNRLVKVRKEGKASFYSLDDDHVVEILTKGMEHISHGKVSLSNSYPSNQDN